MWPAMLMSAGIPLPRKVWVHGWLLAQGERMSKSRGNFLDPIDMAAALGTDGTRYVTLREVAFDRDSDVSWDSFVKRYNADLANDYGNLVNRTVTMAGRYLEGVRPAPQAADISPLASLWAEAVATYAEKIDSFLLHEALVALWAFVAAANRYVDAEQPWVLAKAAAAGDAGAGERLRAVLGDLVEAARLIGLASAPFLPNTAPRVLAQLGFDYGYGADGNDGPRILDELAWGTHATDAGRLAAAVPLFPRLELEAVDSGPA
jgi:methionyl-tRNA synthetase